KLIYKLVSFKKHLLAAVENILSNVSFNSGLVRFHFIYVAFHSVLMRSRFGYVEFNSALVRFRFGYVAFHSVLVRPCFEGMSLIILGVGHFLRSAERRVAKWCSASW